MNDLRGGVSVMAAHLIPRPRALMAGCMVQEQACAWGLNAGRTVQPMRDLRVPRFNPLSTIANSRVPFLLMCIGETAHQLCKGQ